MVMFAARDIIVDGIIAGALAAAAVAAWPWGRARGRFAVAGVATLLGWLAWNFTLNHTNATGFNVDAPVVRVSWADAGSGVLAFAAAVLALGLLERREPAGRVLGAAAIAGLVALVVDIFVL